MPRLLLAVCSCLVTACANTTPIQPSSASKSQFEGAVFSGEVVTLYKPTPGEESYRVFQQGATGFVSLQSVRSGVEELATTHCDRKGKAMHGLAETAAKPPYILGNFPRVEFVFECVAKPASSSATIAAGKYGRLAAIKKLLDSGALTQHELKQEKAKVLSEP